MVIGNGESVTERKSLEDCLQKDVDKLRPYLQCRGGEEKLPASENGSNPHTTGAGPVEIQKKARNGAGNGDFHSSSNKKDHLSEKPGKIGSVLRILLVDIPLCLIFVLFVGTFTLKTIFHQYWLPLMEKFGRTYSDEQIFKEFTYYERSCTLSDISTLDLQDLVLTNTTDDVDVTMRHGAAVIPQVLDPQTVQELRKFIARRNAALTYEEAIPLDQGRNRASFGIDTDDDPIVPIALRQIATHPVLKPLLEGLVGKDPALSEITAITAWAGAPNQVWHSDVKADGNALKFGRTYSHSYSLFIPLQDTTGKMGATDLCPGTHYCANDLGDTCEKYGQQLNEASRDRVWHSGDGAILNQQVWHRGTKHVAFKSPERIVFIVSFIGRPRLGHDPRQLARGTYFHMKWNMWGHTWKDMYDSHRSMTKPFSILRCMGIWKPRNRNYGYDLMTSAAMRIANAQNGMTWDELPPFVEQVVDRIGIPQSLQGPILENDSAWQVYLRDTIDLNAHFLGAVNAIIFAIYGILILVLAIRDRSFNPLRRSFVHLFFTHGVPALLALYLLLSIKYSDWGSRIEKDTIMKHPFPAWIESVEDPTVSNGPTTLPEPDDVLVGSRFDVRFLEAYDRWLDYHPGNEALKMMVAGSVGFTESMEASLVDFFLKQSNRILEQDWRTGKWRVMNFEDSERYLLREIKRANCDVLAFVDKGIAYQLSKYRFEAKNTIMSAKSRAYLSHLRSLLFAEFRLDEDEGSALALSSPKASRKFRSGPMPRAPKWMDDMKIDPLPSRWSPPSLDETMILPHDIVAVNYKNRGHWFRAEVLFAPQRNTYDVLFEGEGQMRRKIPRHLIQKMVPLAEGSIIEADFERRGEMFPGRVQQVYPSGLIDVLYDDGDQESGVWPEYYRQMDF